MNGQVTHPRVSACKPLPSCPYPLPAIPSPALYAQTPTWSPASRLSVQAEIGYSSDLSNPPNKEMIDRQVSPKKMNLGALHIWGAVRREHKPLTGPYLTV